MARLSKTSSIKIYEDEAKPDPDSQKENRDSTHSTSKTEEIQQEEQEFWTEDDGAVQALDLVLYEEDEDADDERRDSSLTTASVSSFPISAYETDTELTFPINLPYAPPVLRPTFRRPGSVRRMQMTSPPPLSSRSPRQSIVSSYSRSRARTANSVQFSTAEEGTRVSESEGQRQYPLVLLHLTLLPLNLPWSVESMRDLLPEKTLEDLQLLQSRLAETVLQRGILVPHPRQEYELLEERLLEALELQEERITKCGHFRPPPRYSSGSSTSSGRESDSGLGSSVDGSDGGRCETCPHHVKASASGVKDKWVIKVFAANGLMRSSAWAAAWSEMESVDVEILPWISEDVRRKLDERRVVKAADELARSKDKEARIEQIVEERVRVACEEMRRVLETPKPASMTEKISTPPDVARPNAPVNNSTDVDQPKSKQTDLPPIYRPSQIPLSVLMKNYIFLLAQDGRNVIMFCLSILVLFFALRQGPVSNHEVLPSLEKTCDQYQPVLLSQPALENATAVLEETAAATGGWVESATNAILEDNAKFSEELAAANPPAEEEKQKEASADSLQDEEDFMEVIADAD